MVQISKLNVGSRKTELLKPLKESRKVMLSHPGSLPYTWTKRSESLTPLEPRQLPLYGHNYVVNDPPNLASSLVHAVTFM